MALDRVRVRRYTFLKIPDVTVRHGFSPANLLLCFRNATHEDDAEHNPAMQQRRHKTCIPSFMTTRRICSSFWTLAICFASSAARFTGKSGLEWCVASASSFLVGPTTTTTTNKAPLLPSRRRRSCVVVSQRQMSSSSSSSSTSPPKLQPGDALFGKFVIPADSIFYRSNSGQSLAFVNLRPIVPGHVLVIPAKNICENMSDLTMAEYIDLWQTVRTVQDILRQASSCAAFNVAVQDGQAAGQSVPHVHVHILPRCAGDFERNDDVYDELQEWAPRPDCQSSKAKLDVPGDGERRDRTVQEMAEEAAVYRAIVEKEI